MAIAKIKHIDIFFTKQEKEKVLYLVQKSGVIQLLQAKDIPSSVVEESPRDLENIQQAIDYLETFSAEKGFFSQKPFLKEEEIGRTLQGVDIRFIIHHLGRIRERIKSLQVELDRLYGTKNNLLPWQEVSLSLRDITTTQYVELILGIVNRKQLLTLEEDLRKNKLNLYFELINQKDNLAYVLIIYLKQEKEETISLLKKYDFNHVILPKAERTPRETILELDDKINKLNEEKQDLWKEARALVSEKLKLMVLADRLNNERARKEISAKILETHYVSLISGWIKEKDLLCLRNVLSGLADIEIITRDPKQGEEVPVVLENKRLIEPFEFITKIYGMPKYTEIDPTPFLAPFFFLYFGFCVSDVGYGLMLVLICWFVLKKFKMGTSGVSFFKLFLYCGISTMVIGALTGSWFGNLFDLLGGSYKIFLPLKRFKDSLIILDPLKEPTKLLGVALCLGIIQVWFGNIVAAIGNIKNKRYLDIVLDQLSMLTLLFGLTGLGLIALNLLNQGNILLFKSAALAGAVMLIFTQGRSEKTIGSKLFYGIYNLYSALSGYLSDILSYSRLWALGMVTGVMATTINLISVQFSQMLTTAIPLINKINFIKMTITGIVLIVLFTVGHIFSFLMNLLGAFVHPVRLQFVEFFSKFFKSGGSSFRPFKVETKYINIG